MKYILAVYPMRRGENMLNSIISQIPRGRRQQKDKGRVLPIYNVVIPVYFTSLNQLYTRRQVRAVTFAPSPQTCCQETEILARPPGFQLIQAQKSCAPGGREFPCRINIDSVYAGDKDLYPTCSVKPGPASRIAQVRLF